MILVGAQRGGAKNLALHLLKEENDHVEIHELRGFVSDSLMGAFHEAYAISRGTKCRQFLYSLSLNPPQDAKVSTSDFEAAIKKAEDTLGLSDQPRAVVFHEKEGRRHCHVVWSRIDPESMKAVPLPFTKRKLQNLARELYIEHGWTMPKGLTGPGLADPRNFTLAEWQQAKRAGVDPRALKMVIQDAWAISDRRASFAAALDESGLALARGDRRGFVVVDIHGEAYAVARWVGTKSKAVKARLGDPTELPSVEEAVATLREPLTRRISRETEAHDLMLRRMRTTFRRERDRLVEQQRRERTELRTRQATLEEALALKQAQSFRRGLTGLLDRLTGRHQKIQSRYLSERYQLYTQHQHVRDEVVCRHLADRREQESAFQAQERRVAFEKEQGIVGLRELSLGVDYEPTNGMGGPSME